jgi:hypothetical protein
MAHLEYKAPATIPTVDRLMTRGQHYEDNSLKHLQYLLSAVFRPLDILCHELVSTEFRSPNLERYSSMLRDVRQLLLHVCSAMNQNRNNVALRAINPSFSLKTDPTTNYTLPLEESQQTLIQQTAARRAIRETTVNRRNRRRTTSGNSGASGILLNGSEQQFFVADLPSQQNDFNNINFNTNNNTNYNNNTSSPSQFKSFRQVQQRESASLSLSLLSLYQPDYIVNLSHYAHMNLGSLFGRWLHLAPWI